MDAIKRITMALQEEMITSPKILQKLIHYRNDLTTKNNYRSSTDPSSFPSLLCTLLLSLYIATFTFLKSNTFLVNRNFTSILNESGRCLQPLKSLVVCQLRIIYMFNGSASLSLSFIATQSSVSVDRSKLFPTISTKK